MPWLSSSRSSPPGFELRWTSRFQVVFSDTICDSPIMAMQRKSGRGGARPGAGRPAIMQEPTPFTVTIDRADYDALAQIAGRRGVTLATVVRDVLQRYARRQRR